MNGEARIGWWVAGCLALFSWGCGAEPVTSLCSRVTPKIVSVSNPTPRFGEWITVETQVADPTCIAAVKVGEVVAPFEVKSFAQERAELRVRIPFPGGDLTLQTLSGGTASSVLATPPVSTTTMPSPTGIVASGTEGWWLLSPEEGTLTAVMWPWVTYGTPPPSSETVTGSWKKPIWAAGGEWGGQFWALLADGNQIFWVTSQGASPLTMPAGEPVPITAKAASDGVYFYAVTTADCLNQPVTLWRWILTSSSIQGPTAVTTITTRPNNGICDKVNEWATLTQDPSQSFATSPFRFTVDPRDGTLYSWVAEFTDTILPGDTSLAVKRFPFPPGDAPQLITHVEVTDLMSLGEGALLDAIWWSGTGLCVAAHASQTFLGSARYAYGIWCETVSNAWEEIYFFAGSDEEAETHPLVPWNGVVGIQGERTAWAFKGDVLRNLKGEDQIWPLGETPQDYKTPVRAVRKEDGYRLILRDGSGNLWQTVLPGETRRREP